MAVLVELVHVQLQASGDFHDFLFVDLIVIVEQLLMKGPELALPARRQSGHGTLLGKWMTGKGKMLDHVVDLIGELFQHLLDIALQTRTIRSLVVVEHNQGDLGIRGALDRPAGQVDIVYAAEPDDLDP